MKKCILIIFAALPLCIASRVEADDYRYTLRRKQAIAGTKEGTPPFCHARKKTVATEPLKSQFVRNGEQTSRFTTLKSGDIKEVLKDKKSKNRCVFFHAPEKRGSTSPHPLKG